MKTNEIITDIRKNGGLDLNFIEFAAKGEGCGMVQYIRAYIRANYTCSWYVANRVANYFA